MSETFYYIIVFFFLCLQAKDSDDDEEVVQVDRDHFMDEFFEQVRHNNSTHTHTQGGSYDSVFDSDAVYSYYHLM